MKPIIRVKNLSKQYKVRLGKTPFPTFRESIVNSLKSPLKKFGKNNSENFWALRDINFEVEPGEVIGIIETPLAVRMNITVSGRIFVLVFDHSQNFKSKTFGLFKIIFSFRSEPD